MLNAISTGNPILPIIMKIPSELINGGHSLMMSGYFSLKEGRKMVKFNWKVDAAIRRKRNIRDGKFRP